MKDTPLPFTVWAIRTVGLPLVAAASAKHAWIAGDVMAVELEHVPAEGSPLVGQRLQFHDVLHETVELDAVVVHDGADVIDLVEGAEHGGFPDLAFLDFAVAQHHIDAGRAAVHPQREAHAQREGEAVAERTGGGLEHGEEAHVRVALVDGAELAQGVQLVFGAVARFGQRGVEHRRGMALGKDEAVAVGPLGVGRIVPHGIEIERSDDIGGGERAARMAGARGSRHLNDVPPHAPGDRLQFFDGLLRHG